MRITWIAAGLLVSPLVVAAPKKGPAAAPAAGTTTKNFGPCGAKVLPLVEGNEWTYVPIAAPQPAEKQIELISPPRADKIVITVKQVDAKKGQDTVVTLEEQISIDLNKDPKKQPQLDTRTITSTITCGKNKFEISPNSFFFAGEPGGAFGLELTDIQRPKDTSWKLTAQGGIGDQPWREDIVAKWTRSATPNSEAKMGSGKLELERAFTPQQPETVTTKVGEFKSEKLGLITTGRVTLDEKKWEGSKPSELPAGWVTQIWAAQGVGVVQTLNSFAHEYQLTDVKLK